MAKLNESTVEDAALPRTPKAFASGELWGLPAFARHQRGKSDEIRVSPVVKTSDFARRAATDRMTDKTDAGKILEVGS